jgi:DNA-binding CsgD family transcriptional regulator
MRSEPQQASDRLLELIGEVVGLLDLAEFRSGLLSALRRAVPAGWISLNDIASDPAETAVLIDPPFPPEAHALYARYAHQNPLLERYRQTNDGRAYRFSDVTTAEALHATDLYREFYAPLGLEYQIALTLPAPPGRVLALALSRAHEDFADPEREMLDRARPFLIQAYRNAIAHTRLRADLALRPSTRPLPLEDPSLMAAFEARRLTSREAEVLSCAAAGRSSRQIAQLLGVSERTTQKHLQRCFAKLGVRSRAEAADLAWSWVSAQGEPPDRRQAG